MNVTQRISDWLLERRIAHLSRSLIGAVQAKRTHEARAIQDEWAAALLSRSPDQIRRMDRRIFGSTNGR